MSLKREFRKHVCNFMDGRRSAIDLAQWIIDQMTNGALAGEQDPEFEASVCDTDSMLMQYEKGQVSEEMLRMFLNGLVNRGRYELVVVR